MANESDVRILDIPGYFEWSTAKIKAGGSDAIIANLDARCMWLSPEEVLLITSEDFEEMYQEVLDDIGGEE